MERDRSVIREVAFPTKINEDAIGMAETILAGLRDGSLVSFYAVAAQADGGCTTAISKTNDLWRDLAMIERLRHRIMTGIDK
jgi:hypothetical protein